LPQFSRHFFIGRERFTALIIVVRYQFLLSQPSYRPASTNNRSASDNWIASAGLSPMSRAMPAVYH